MNLISQGGERKEEEKEEEEEEEEEEINLPKWQPRGQGQSEFERREE